MNLQYAYDLDGTLIETRTANWMAYKQLGVEPPVDFHQRPWETWCARTVHERKNAILPSYAGHMRMLPMFAFALHHKGTILSMCSEKAFELIIETFPRLRDIGPIHIGLSVDRRLSWLRNNQQEGTRRFYFDDSPSFCDILEREKIGWQTCRIFPR